MSSLNQKIEVTVPAPSTLPLSKIVKRCMTGYENSRLTGTAWAIFQNRILVLPEDAGRGLLKTMAMRSMYLTALAIIVGLISWFGFRYWYKDSQNSRFRKACTGTIWLQILLKNRNYKANWTVWIYPLSINTGRTASHVTRNADNGIED